MLTLIKYIVYSILIIFCFHHVMDYFISMWTIPKIVNLEHSMARHREMMKKIGSSVSIINKSNNDNPNNDIYNIPASTLDADDETMKRELKEFLHSKTSNINTTNNAGSSYY